jgi:ABC-type antimicrobial peptide transport system permease subunit
VSCPTSLRNGRTRSGSASHGADRHAVVGLILAESIAVLIVGVAGGVALTIVAGRGLSALLYGVQPYDPRSLAIACAAIAAVALGATVLPARRAANVEPMTALRHE